MFLQIIFLFYISIVSANDHLFGGFFNEIGLNDVNQTQLRRYPRASSNKGDFVETSPNCHQLSQNNVSPFIVIMLYRTSGNFLGMGSIVDKKTVLSAARVVQHTMQKPSELLVLAGRLGPWWGKDSQVQPASEIFQNEDLALVVLKKELRFNKHVRPIRIPITVASDLIKEYTKYWAIFGIPKSSWDIPGEKTPKTNMYIMKIESGPDKKPENDACKASYPDLEFNDTTMTCSFANGTYCWGCLGSPTVAINSKNKLMQIGVLIRTTYSDTDEYHVHILLSYFEQWIRSHSLAGYK